MIRVATVFCLFLAGALPALAASVPTGVAGSSVENGPDAAPWRDAPAFIQARQREVRSAATGRVYRILVSVPETPPPATGFPVLYLLDGDATFPVAALINREWRRNGPSLGIHPGVIVGIAHIKTDADQNPRADDFTPPAADLGDTGDFSGGKQGGADRFLDFLENEIKPLLAAEFSLDPKRQTLFGHSYGGLFVLHTLFTRPETFQRYVAASPSIWWNDRHILRSRDTFLKTALPALQKNATAPTVLVTVGDLEQTPLPHHRQADRAEMVVARRQVDNARELAASLTRAGVPSRLHVFENENHGTARVPAINHAIRVAFGE